MVGPDVAGRRQVVVGAARQHGGLSFGQDVAQVDTTVMLLLHLKHSPRILLLVATPFHPHEMPATLQPLPVQDEFKVSLGDAGSGIADRPSMSGVPSKG